MFHVERDHIEAEVKSSGSDYEVFDCNRDPDCGLFTFDATGKLGNGERNGMDEEASEDILSEGAATLPMADQFGPVNAVSRLDGADCRYANIKFSVGRLHLPEDVLRGIASPLKGN